MKRIPILLAATLVAAASCQSTWLMYDTTQTDHLYFQEYRQTHTASFALIPDDEITVSTTVYLMGVPSDQDREFEIEYLEVPEGETFSTGGVTYPVVTGRPGIDYYVKQCILPAGATSTSLDVVLQRTPRMLENVMVRVGIRLVDNANFLAVAADSSRVSAIMGPDFYIYVNDGEPSCPSWWCDSKQVLGWNFGLGNFYPDKYRRLLAYFHEAETTNPTFYNWAVAAYGYYLDTPNLAYYGGSKTDPADQLTDMMNTFWRKRYSSAWARYVFIPLYEYYKDYYQNHPDDPHFERMGVVNQNDRVGWADPMDSGYGFFN